MAVQPPWTILKLLRWTTTYFTDKGVDQPRPSAEILLAHALDLRRIDLYTRHDQPLVETELQRFKSLIRRRASHEPVAYITGRKAFWTLDLGVGPEVLIPRPETELLVEAAMELLPPAATERLRVLDLGTGSGAIILSLAAERPGHLFLASDRSPQALDRARRNASEAAIETPPLWIRGSWFAPFRPEPSLDVVVSNPPYIRAADLETLMPDVRHYEPVAALDGGPDGLAAYGHIIGEAPARIRPGGWLLLEIGHDQGDEVSALAERTGAFEPAVRRRDYAGLERIVLLRRRS